MDNKPQPPELTNAEEILATAAVKPDPNPDTYRVYDYSESTLKSRIAAYRRAFSELGSLVVTLPVEREDLLGANRNTYGPLIDFAIDLLDYNTVRISKKVIPPPIQPPQ